MPMDWKTQQILLEIFKTELEELHQSLIEGLLLLEKASSPVELEAILAELFRHSHNMKGAATSASVQAIAQIAHRLEDLFTEWRSNHHFPDKKQISACLKVNDNILQVLELHCKKEPIDLKASLAPLNGGEVLFVESPKLSQEEVIKLPLLRVERASAKANEFINYQLKLENWFKEIALSVQEVQQAKASFAFPDIVKKLNALSNESASFLGEFSRSVQSLQDELKTMRMLPISTVLLPLNRTARDVGLSLNKSVELKVEGGDIELDKNILDAIRDPLQHLLRNSLAHGIESNADREQLKKPLPAKIYIRISQASGTIKLEFCDDGQGIDLQKIKKRAIAKRLYSPEALEKMDDKQVLNCIFASGFSLEEEITELSGRGVGLDIVKNNIQKVHGTIEVSTTLGQGSCFTLKLPLTLSTTRGLFFKLHDQTFMLPTTSLKALYEINPSKLKQVDNKYIFVINQQPVPIQRMHQLLQIEEPNTTIDRNSYGLLIEDPNTDILLLVDTIMDEHTCVVTPLPFPYNHLEQYIGITLTGESAMALVLDPSQLLRIALTSDKAWLKIERNASLAQAVTQKKRILIVDDSLTARILCANALEAAGYEVVSAVDGQKAWAEIQKEKFDCVITDILMPRMDGFELTKLIKTHHEYASIPVIIVSSLGSKKEKQHGLEAGANAFIVKSEFDTHALIEMLDSIL